MHTDTSFQLAVVDLQKRGFDQDFVLFDNKLLWVQEKDFIPEHNFSILECYRFRPIDGMLDDLVLLGVAALDESIKGILLNHYAFTSAIPRVIVQKLRRFGFYKQ